MASIRPVLGAAALAANVFHASAVLTPVAAYAAAGDYRFELAAPPVKTAKGDLIRIRLLHLPDGKPAAGALIFQTRFDMGPQGMAGMTAPAKVSATPQPGIYEIAVEPQMGGNWALSLSAKVAGEAETVRGTVAVPVPQ
jgi:YtkA-like